MFCAMLFLGVQASPLLRKPSGWLCSQVFAGLISLDLIAGVTLAA